MEIRGQRCIYVASGPGLFVQVLHKGLYVDFVILLDEVDETGRIHRYPCAALVQVWIPNTTFQRKSKKKSSLQLLGM